MNLLRWTYRNLLRWIYRRLRSPRTRKAYTSWVSLACRGLGIPSLRGSVGDLPLYVSSQDSWGLRKFYFGRKYDPRNIERLRGILDSERDFVFWDVGANYGTYTLLLGRHARTTIAIEPASRTFRHLRMSCARSPGRVILENCAVGDRVGDTTLYLSKDHSGDHRTYAPAVRGQVRRTEAVRLRTIDDIAASHFDPLPDKNLMKIDVQGVEPRVLRGAKRLIDHSDTIFVFMELWPKGLKEDGSSLGELVDLCGQCGLVPVDESRHPTDWAEIVARFDAEGEALVLNVLLTRPPRPGQAHRNAATL